MQEGCTLWSCTHAFAGRSLSKGSAREKRRPRHPHLVCLVFEKVNTGGVPLSVFELITATYAADGYNLRDDWFGSKARNVDSRKERVEQDALLEGIEATAFLQGVSLLRRSSP